MTERITIRETVRIKLEESSDPEYREFHSRLLPGITGIMGVRTPVLRGIAKDLKKSGWQEYIKEVSGAWKEKGQGNRRRSLRRNDNLGAVYLRRLP